MTNEVIRGVAKAIVAKFPTIPVYTEKVDQGIEEPSFVIRCYRNRDNLYRGKRYFKEHRIEIQYFPPAENRRENAHSIEEQLFRTLEWITVGAEEAKIMGKNMESVIDSDSYTVIFTLMYDYFVIAKEDEDPMETMTGEVEITDGGYEEYTSEVNEDDEEN